MTETQTQEPLTIAGHPFRAFNSLEAAFGASLSDYPNMDELPEDYRRGRALGCSVFSALFFDGGKLSDHGRELVPGTDKGLFYATLRALMSSWEPPHELKVATCGLLIDTYAPPIEASHD